MYKVISSQSRFNIGDENSIPIKVLGAGTFGTVILCGRTAPINVATIINQNRKKKIIQYNVPYVCVKRIQIQSESILTLVNKEIFIVSKLSHPCIIKFFNYYFHQNTVNIVMEYASGGTLRNLIDNRKVNLNETNIRKLFCDILLGLEYIHIRGVVHRDLKPENILLDAYNRPKIADFGISFVHTDLLTETQNSLGTPIYIAPEILIGKRPNFSADIWALGVILHELCTFVNPFKSVKSMDQLYKILLFSKSKSINCNNHKFTLPLKRICEGMLTFNSNYRYTISKIVADPFIGKYYNHLYFQYCHYYE